MNPPARPSPGGSAANAPRERHYTPGEFSAALAEHGITLHPVTVRWRCGLPEGVPLRIGANPNYPGRHYIPESELIRLVTTKDHEKRL
jgi:hypothetical protein